MLTLTQNAADAVQQIVTSSPEIPDETGGIRLFDAVATEDELRIAMAPAGVPVDDDQVISVGEARVFVEVDLADELDDMALDVETIGKTVRFTIVEQAP